MANADGVMGRHAGWYPDPVTVGTARYWNGTEWTDLVAWGGVTRHDTTPLSEVDRIEAAAEAAIVSEYLTDAVSRNIVNAEVADALRIDVEQRVPTDKTPKPIATTAAALPSTDPTDTGLDLGGSPIFGPPPTGARAVSSGRFSSNLDDQPVQPIIREPGRLAQWWSDAHVAVRSEIALHGLAYLGVLLLFAGVTGLITFSFGDVDPWVRALAEFMVPGALFLSAWYLHRRRATVVAASLAFLAGAISPIVVTASLTDGAPFPPDVSGRMLPIAQGAAVALVAIVMVLVVRRWPASPLRFVAAPALWMAAGLVAGVWHDQVPAGYDTARPDSLQLAVIFASLTATMMLCSWSRVPTALASATRLVALPVAGIVYVLEIVLAANEGWPLASTILVGLGALLLLEMSSERLMATATSSLQLVAVVIAAARFSAKVDPEWVAMGTAVLLLALVEYFGRRRPVNVVTLAGLALSGTAFLLTLGDVRAAAAAFGTLTLWGLWRHVQHADWLPISDDVGVVPALAAVVTTAALWDLAERGPAIIATAAAVLVIAIAGRLWQPIANDPMWKWFVPSAAGVVSVISIGFLWGDLDTEVAVASAMLVGAVALSALPVSVKAWASSALVVWSFAAAAESLDIGYDEQSVALAVAALALVVGSLVIAKPICVHYASIGHALGLAALVVPTWTGWAAASVVAAATTGWWATMIIDERGEAVHLAALRARMANTSDESGSHWAGHEDLVGVLAPLASLLGLWATVFLVVDAAGWVAYDDPWSAAVSGGVFLVAAIAIRFVPWRRARRSLLVWATLVGVVAAALVAISSVGADSTHWSPVVCLALVLAVVGVTSAPRPLGITWTGWVGCAALTVFLADRLGLDRDWSDIALAGWGAVALLGGLAANRIRHGPSPTGTFVQDRLLVPPTVLGASVFVVGGIFGLSAGTETGIGWTAAGMSAVVLAAALLLPLGVLVALAEVLATASYILLAPWEPLDRPWTFVPFVLLLLGASLATRRSGGWSPGRWDLPSFFVAHGVAALALAAAAESAESATVVATYAGFGAIAIAIAAVLRRWPWAVAGAVLVLVAGYDAGHGWFALVLVIEGIALTVAGLLRTQAVRWVLVTAGTWSIIGAWFDLVVWRSWAPSTIFYTSVSAGAGVALIAVLGLRSGRVARELAAVWAISCSVVVVVVATVGIDQVARRPGGLVLAGSVFVLAVAAGLAAVVVGSGMRWVASALAAAAWVPAAWALEISDTMATLAGTTVALVVLTVVLFTHGRRPGALWLHPGALYAVVTQGGAAIAALSAYPNRDLLIIVLLAVSAELVVFGVLLRRPELFVLSPVAACSAWLLYAADALAGAANWFTVPVGFSMLVMVGLVRWIRRGRGGDPAAPELVVLEFVGMSFLVAPTLARTISGHLWNGVFAIGIGVLIAAWGVLTSVRWRAGFGAASVVLATVLLIGVPLSRSVSWSGPVLWGTISVIGVSAILVASVLERSRDQMGHLVRRMDEMTAGWEKVSRLSDRGEEHQAESVKD